MRRLFFAVALTCIGCSPTMGGLRPNETPLTPLPVGLASCEVAGLPRVTSQYDPVTDTTTAFMDRLRFGEVYGTQWEITSQAAAAGRLSTQRVTPRFWIHVDDPVSDISPSFVALVDDTLRIRWTQAGEGFQTVTVGLFGGEGTLEYHAYTPSLSEFARFASGKKATIAFAHLRTTLDEKQLRRFAEIYLWSQCPSLRKEPLVRK